MLSAYLETEPPSELFVEVAEAKYLGRTKDHRFLYYDFVWSGAEHSYRGTQKLLVFDRHNRYLGNYYLGAAITPESCRVDGERVTLVYEEDGERIALDFSLGLPESSTPVGLSFHPHSEAKP